MGLPANTTLSTSGWPGWVHPKVMVSADVGSDAFELDAMPEHDLVELLEDALGYAHAQLLDARRVSIHSRPGRSTSHVFHALVEDEGAQRKVVLVAHQDARRYPKGAFVVRSGATEVAVWRFPHDPYVPGLSAATNVERVRELLDRLGAPAGAVTLVTRAYRPSRRGVVEVSIDTGDVAGRILYFKAVRRRRAARLAATYRQLSPHVPVPSIVGIDERHDLLALEALEGLTLRQTLISDHPLPDPTEVLALLERFAGIHADPSPTADPRAFADPRRHVPMLKNLLPELAETIERVATAASRIDGVATMVHGDLHDGQLLVQGAAITGVLDVDGAGMGHIAHDAGSLIAHVEAVGSVWPDAADRSLRYADALRAVLSGSYGEETLARAEAGAWIGLATGPYRSQEPNWLAETRRRVERAESALE